MLHLMLRLTLLCLFGLTYSQVSAELGAEAIVGGNFPKKDDFKYSIAILFGNDRCGGAIIGDQYILTVAHCVTGPDGHIVIQPYKVIAGTHDLKHTHDAFVVPVETVYVYKYFVRRTHLNDIAVLKLKHKLNLISHSHKVDKINLPKPSAVFDNVRAVVSGFGDHSVIIHNNKGKMEELRGQNDDKLRFANVRVIPNIKCGELLNGKIIYPSYICGQVDQRDDKHHHYEGVCNGDSGSPLVYGNEVIGLVSSSPYACNETTDPATYQRVSSFLNMIHSVLNGKPNEEVVHKDVPH